VARIQESAIGQAHALSSGLVCIAGWRQAGYSHARNRGKQEARARAAISGTCGEGSMGGLWEADGRSRTFAFAHGCWSWSLLTLGRVKDCKTDGLTMPPISSCRT
jgi:hypothetical protein